MVQKMTEIVNAPGNLKIVPQWLYDRVSVAYARFFVKLTRA